MAGHRPPCGARGRTAERPGGRHLRVPLSGARGVTRRCPHSLRVKGFPSVLENRDVQLRRTWVRARGPEREERRAWPAAGRRVLHALPEAPFVCSSRKAASEPQVLGCHGRLGGGREDVGARRLTAEAGWDVTRPVASCGSCTHGHSCLPPCHGAAQRVPPPCPPLPPFRGKPTAATRWVHAEERGPAWRLSCSAGPCLPTAGLADLGRRGTLHARTGGGEGVRTGTAPPSLARPSLCPSSLSPLGTPHGEQPLGPLLEPPRSRLVLGAQGRGFGRRARGGRGGVRTPSV